MSEAAYSIGEWTSAEGLTLRYRDYPQSDKARDEGAVGRPPILCIPGLTRNARDFEPIAASFAGEWRVICVDLRGRGKSEYAKDSSTYTPIHYVQDIVALLDHLGLEKVVLIGTSLGGIVSMLLGLQHGDRIAGAVLNDVGPVIETEGLARIRDYVGLGRSFSTWMHAARALKEQSGRAYPDYGLANWLTLAKRLMLVTGSGRIAFDYDMKIADPFNTPAAEGVVDMWPALRALSGRPVLVLRGELSDILSAATLARMEREVRGLEAVTIPCTGHAPTLEEPGAQAAIARLLAKVAQPPAKVV